MSTLTSLQDAFGAEAAERFRHYVCPECGEILLDAVQTNCGHFLCEDCAGLAFFQHKKNTRCPRVDCRKLLLGEDGTQYFPDRHLRREIDEINKTRVMCRVIGCSWNECYKDYMVHCQEQHPTAIWQSMSRRRASHALVTIQDKCLLDQTQRDMRDKAEQFKQSADDLNQMADQIKSATGGKMKYVDRLKADSLNASQKKSGAEASSNQSLKRANEPKLFQGQSNTLDAATACDQVRFETTPETELQPKEEVLKKGKQKLVHGLSKKSSHQRNPSNVISKRSPSPINLPLLSDAQPEPRQPAEANGRTNTSATASNSRRDVPASRRRKVPSALTQVNPGPYFIFPPSVPPRSPNTLRLVVPTHQPPALNPQPLSPQLQLPTIPQAIVPLSLPPVPSTTSPIPPPTVLRTRRTPVPQALSKAKKVNSMPQEYKCCQCKQKDDKINILKNTVEKLLKCATCNEKKLFQRYRFMSL